MKQRDGAAARVSARAFGLSLACAFGLSLACAVVACALAACAEKQVCECAAHVGGVPPVNEEDQRTRSDGLHRCLEAHGGGTINGCPMPPSMAPAPSPQPMPMPKATPSSEGPN